MRPALIVDFSDRTFSALLVTAEGRIDPCSQEIRQVLTRTFSAEVLFDPQVTNDPDFDWDDAVEALTKAGTRGFFHRARRLGLRRPWELASPAEALRLSSPLAVLSSPAALADPLIQPVLPEVAIVLLDALLEPVFAYLANREHGARTMDAFVVVPASTGRQARLAFHKVFRRRGFRRLTIVSREVAAALALAGEPPAQLLVWDAMGDDLHLSKVAVESTAGRCRVQVLSARTVRGLGWPYWVRQILMALALKGRIPDPPGAMLPALDRALMGLLSDSQDSADLPTSPPLRLTHELLQELFDAEGSQALLVDLLDRLGSHLAAFDIKGSPVILLGAACGVEKIQKAILSLMDGSQPETVAGIKTLERGARGIAAARLWLRDETGRRVEIPPSGSLRLNTLHGDACELLPAAKLPSPGEQCCLQQAFHFAGDRGAADPFLLHLLWGADPSPEGNASLCTLPLERTSASGDGGELLLSLHLRRSAGGRLSATVDAGFAGDATPQRRARAFFAEDFATFPSSVGT